MKASRLLRWITVHCKLLYRSIRHVANVVYATARGVDEGERAAFAESFSATFLRRRTDDQVPRIRARAAFAEALNSLSTARGRSVLALIGIVIGIGSVIAMISVSKIVKQESLNQFKGLGTELLMIRQDFRVGNSRTAGMRVADTYGLAAMPHIVDATTWELHFGDAYFRGSKLSSGTTLGVTSSFSDVNRLPLARGRFISDLDGYRNFCVVGAEIANELRQKGAAKVVGSDVRLFGQLYTIVGVLSETSPRRFEQQFNPNISFYVPIENIFRKTGTRNLVQHMLARMTPDTLPPVAEGDIAEYFSQRDPPLSYTVTNAKRLLERLQKQGQLFTVLLAVIGSISLIVGGVGIMNVMLISVNERRSEIGLRRALGARRRDVRNQFLIEGVALCLVGGIIGILLGISASYAICEVSDWPFALSFTAMVLGVTVATSIGLFFGLYPAYQASRLDPNAALRSS